MTPPNVVNMPMCAREDWQVYEYRQILALDWGSRGYISLLLYLWADPVCLRLAALLAKHEYDAAALAPGPELLTLVTRVRARQVAWPIPLMEFKGLFLHLLPHTQPKYPETYIFPLNVLNIQAYVIVFYRLAEAKAPGAQRRATPTRVSGSWRSSEGGQSEGTPLDWFRHSLELGYHFLGPQTADGQCERSTCLVALLIR